MSGEGPTQEASESRWGPWLERNTLALFPVEFCSVWSFVNAPSSSVMIAINQALWGLGGKVKRLRGGEPHRHRQQCGHYQRKGDGGGGRGQRGHKWRPKETWFGAVSTWCSVQMMCYRAVHLKPIQFLIHPNTFFKIMCVIERLYVRDKKNRGREREYFCVLKNKWDFVSCLDRCALWHLDHNFSLTCLSSRGKHVNSLRNLGRSLQNCGVESVLS